MKPWLHKIEVSVDKSIPYLLFALLFLIVGEIFYQNMLEPYIFYISIFDNIIIIIFVLDLIFKYIRAITLPDFLRRHWLEIIAVLPASLFVRLIEGIIPVSTFEVSQSALHEAAEFKRESKLIIMEVEKAGQITRMDYFLRFLRPLARLPRFMKAFEFYEKPINPHKTDNKTKKKTSKRPK